MESKKINRHPFEMDKSITGFDLLDNGYRWMPGVDVILIGKKTKDTLDYYQLNMPDEEIDEEEVFDIEEDEVSIQKRDTTDITSMESIDPLEMPDSMYNRIWRVDERKYRDVFGNGIPAARYFFITMTKEKLDMFMNTIDSSKYELNRESEIHDYDNDEFLIINLHQKDTFRCSVKALDDGKFEFLSQSSLKK